MAKLPNLTYTCQEIVLHLLAIKIELLDIYKKWTIEPF